MSGLLKEKIYLRQVIKEFFCLFTVKKTGNTRKKWVCCFQFLEPQSGIVFQSIAKNYDKSFMFMTKTLNHNLDNNFTCWIMNSKIMISVFKIKENPFNIDLKRLIFFWLFLKEISNLYYFINTEKGKYDCLKFPISCYILMLLFL